MKERDFFDYWFEGVDGFLDHASAEAVGEFTRSCAEACGASYSRGVFERAFAGGRSLRAALDELTRLFADFSYSMPPEGKDADGAFEVRYARCGCDLVNARGVRSPRLCECSGISLKINLESIYGPGTVSVALKESVLKGDGRCRLVVSFSDGTEPPRRGN